MAPLCEIKIRDGKVYRMLEYFDLVAFMVQLGAIKVRGIAALSAEA